MSRSTAVPPEPGATPATTNNEARPRRQVRDRLSPSVLEELWSIWRADPRIPSVKSRRLWAISRNANPRLVVNWFQRRKTHARKAGKSIPDGSYHLPLGPLTAPERERPATPIEYELAAIPDLPSDDTLVYLPDVDDLNDLDASSDTAFDQDTLMEPKRPDIPAYTEVPHPEQHHNHPKPSSTKSHAAEGFHDKHTSENLSFAICDQGQGKPSNSVCLLCSSESPKVATQLHSRVSPSDPNTSLSVPYSRPDPFSLSLSELSAIPYLFRTPSVVLAGNAVSHPGADNWAIVEDKLGRFVNDGKLDFSFLDVPHLTSMELIG